MTLFCLYIYYTYIYEYINIYIKYTQIYKKRKKGQPNIIKT